MASVWLTPPHWVTRFRAFNTMVEGAADYLALLVKRFKIAWEGVEKGDPALFGHLLKQQLYYTADENQYVKTLMGAYAILAKMPFDYDSLPSLTEEEKERIGNIVSLSLYQSIGESLDQDSVPPDDESNT